MSFLLAVSRHASHNGRRVAEVGLLLFLVAGVWLVVAEFQEFGRAKAIVAGSALAVGAVLLIVAVHFGNFG
jgi:hypothetical protein